MTRELRLRRGQVAIVDDDCFDWLSQWDWHLSPDGYAMRGAATGTRSGGGSVAMHRVVAGAAPGEVVDHINRDTLDNRRANLRICTQKDNSRNRRGWMSGASIYKGVSYDRERSIWVANIGVERRTIFLGRYQAEEDAARAYDAAARYAFKQFAHCNFADGEDLPPESVCARLDAAVRAERKPKTMMTREQRAEALSRALRGEPHAWIAGDYGVSRAAIGGLVFRHKHARRDAA